MISFIFSINQKVRVILSLIYLGIIVLISLMPSEDVPQIAMFDGFDKLVHFCMYFGFTWLICWTLHAESRSNLNYFIIFFVIGWGFIMEVFQLIMQLGRTFEWLDVLANASGTLVGILIYYLMINRMNIHRPQ
jgi:VanZ family protein